MRHRLFAVDVLAGPDRVHEDLLVPVIGNGGDDAVDLLVVEQFFVTPRRSDFSAGNLLRESVAAIVEVARGHAFHAWKSYSRGEQAAALHTHANDAKTNAVARRDFPRGRNASRVEGNAAGGHQGAGGHGTGLQELTARNRISAHDFLQNGRDSFSGVQIGNLG